jgi:hypothetical protein
MTLTGKLEIEFDSVDSLCSQLHQKLQRYGALNQFVRYSIRFMDMDALKVLSKGIKKRLREIEQYRLNRWDRDSANTYLRKQRDDAKLLIDVLKDRRRIAKSELMEVMGWRPMKVAGVIAGMNNMAKKMSRRPVILREGIRRGDEWDIEYRLDESFLNAITQLEDTA